MRGGMTAPYLGGQSPQGTRLEEKKQMNTKTTAAVMKKQVTYNDPGVRK